MDRLRGNGLGLGTNVKIIESFFFDPSHCYLITIGDNCTICPNVRLIAHDASSLKLIGYTRFGKIDIGENCFLGDSVIVLSGVSIGKNSIIGAGSVVTRSIPANSVAAGNPARVICSIREYTDKMETLKSSSTLFDEKYHLHRLTPEKRKQLQSVAKNGFGFIK